MDEPRSAKEIFLEALELDAGERDAFIERECAGDDGLEARVWGLLEAEKGAAEAGLLERPPVDAADLAGAGRMTVMAALEALQGGMPRVTLPGDSDPAPVRPTDPEAEQLLSRGAKGNYEILGEIARGGMGVVLKGRDKDLGREVAVKVLHDSLRRSQTTLERFVEEAQIGGQLQHPGIVPVYELGRMSDERPYFTMKLIRGRTLKELLAERDSPSDDLARMISVFESVCQTVAYAHSRRVIHRDIKPGNVMVGKFGEVQVVDWGLAKVIDAWEGGPEPPPKGPRDTRWVETVRSKDGSSGASDSIAGAIMGTPAYMSPEQARGEIERLDERTDVFALGAVLCEILTGSGPYSGRDQSTLLLASQANLQPAVERLQACGADEELVNLAVACMAPGRELRPRTAAIVAATVARYNEAVAQRLRKAQVAAVTERTRATAARKVQRVSVAAALLVLVALVVSLFQWNRAKGALRRADAARVAEARAKDELDVKNSELKRANDDLVRANEDLGVALDRAGEEARKALAVSGFLTDILSSSTPLKGGRHDLSVREAIEAAVAELDRASLSTQPGVEGKVRQTAGDAFIALGDYTSGQQQLERGRELLLEADGRETDDSLGMWIEIGGAQRGLGELDAAEATFEAVLKKLDGVEGISKAVRPQVLGGLASIARDRAQNERAEELSREAVAHARDSGHAPTVAVQLNDLSIALSRLGRVDEAIEAQEEANAIDREVRGEGHYGTGISLSNLAGLYARAGRIDEAEDSYRRALSVLKATAGERHPLVATSMSSLGRMYVQLKRFHDAWPLLTGSLEIRREALLEGDIQIAFALNNLATLEVELSMIDDAAAHLHEAREIFVARLGEEHPNAVTVTRNLTGVRQRQGQPDVAARNLRRRAADAEERLGPAALETGRWKAWLAAALFEAGVIEEAREQYTQALEVFDLEYGPDSPESAELHAALAEVLAAQGELEDAEVLARRSLVARREALGAEHVGVGHGLVTLAGILAASGDAPGALQAYEDALEVLGPLLPRSHWRFADALSGRAALWTGQGLYREAERDLLGAHKSLTAALGAGHPAAQRAADRLVELYTAWDLADPGGDHDTELERWIEVREGR